MAQGQAATCIELGSGGAAPHVFAPCHFARIVAKVKAGNMMVLANLGTSQTRDIAFRLVRAGAVLAVGFAMIDPFHLKARMEIVPSSCLVSVDDAASGDATANDRDGLGLMFHHYVSVGPLRWRITTTQRRLPLWCWRRRRSTRAIR